MSETLRDRIATAILNAVYDPLCNSAARSAADAVVTEIGLREEMRYPGGTFSFTPPQRRRYVTDWVTDE